MRKHRYAGPVDSESRSVTELNSHIDTVVMQRPIGTLKPFPDNARRHPKAQIAALMRSVSKFGITQPVLIDEHGTILCGHGRVEAAKLAGFQTIPTLTVRGLSFTEKRALNIADNRIGEMSNWDFDLLHKQFVEILSSDVDIELTGFSTGEVDLAIDGHGPGTDRTDPDDDHSELTLDLPAVSQLGDLWEIGRHRLLCGNGLLETSYQALLGNQRAQMIVSDPPYNVHIQGHAMGRGRVRHREFIMASGEMSRAEYTAFLSGAITQFAKFSIDGSIHYIFVDWRHQRELFDAADPIYAEQKNLLVWNKTNAGQGSFYRSKHELILVYKNGMAAHINNFGLGGQGRYRTNVLDYPGVNGLHGARRGDLELHPTVKPIALIADLIRDCSKRDGLILDGFGGSGTTILAAERTGRRAVVMELDPLYVDVTIRRWERLYGVAVRHAVSGEPFQAVARHRAQRAEPPDPENRLLRGSGRAKGGTS